MDKSEVVGLGLCIAGFLAVLMSMQSCTVRQQIEANDACLKIVTDEAVPEMAKVVAVMNGCPRRQ